MFRKELISKLEDIFQFKKTTFDAPSESFEQDTLFVEISDVVCRISNGKSYAKVDGAVIVYTENDKLPYGFFNRKVELADKDLTREFFFFDVDKNAANSPARMQNISERRAKFVYLYSATTDLNLGQLTELET